MRTPRTIRPSASTGTGTSAGAAPRVIVVGGGVGGMSCAGRLSRAGCHVTLLEKNDHLGGRMQSEYIGDYRFDTGPSLLLFPDKYDEAFEALGSPMSECLSLKHITPAAYRVFFPDTPSFRVDLLNDEDAMSAQLESLERGAGEAYRRFLTMARGHLELGVPNFIDRDFTELKDAKGLLDLLPKLSSINPWKLLGPHDMVMRGVFKDPRLRAAFTFQDLYVGLSPATAPGVFSLLAGTELTAGVRYPIGGFGTVRDALQSAIERAGVEVRTNAAVASIDVGDSGKRVDSVTLSTGERLSADIVVCNVDLPVAYSLLKPSLHAMHDAAGNKESSDKLRSQASYAAKRTADLDSLKFSRGIISYNWCVSDEVKELLHHNVFLSSEYTKAWHPATTPDELTRHPNFYLHAPAKTDASAAPPGCESIMVLLPVGNIQDRRQSGCTDPENYDDMVQVGRERVLNTLQDAGVGDIAPMITSEMVITPSDWARRYSLKHGAAFGLSHGLDQLSLFRPANKDAEVGGLYFVGASTRPGNGVPLCFISAKLTAERILKDMVAARAPQ